MQNNFEASEASTTQLQFPSIRNLQERLPLSERQTLHQFKKEEKIQGNFQKFFEGSSIPNLMGKRKNTKNHESFRTQRNNNLFLISSREGQKRIYSKKIRKMEQKFSNSYKPMMNDPEKLKTEEISKKSLKKKDSLPQLETNKNSSPHKDCILLTEINEKEIGEENSKAQETSKMQRIWASSEASKSHLLDLQEAFIDYMKNSNPNYKLSLPEYIYPDPKDFCEFYKIDENARIKEMPKDDINRIVDFVYL